MISYWTSCERIEHVRWLKYDLAVAVETGVGKARPSSRFTGAASALEARARRAREADGRIVENGSCLGADDRSLQRYLRHNIRTMEDSQVEFSERAALAVRRVQCALLMPRTCVSPS